MNRTMICHCKYQLRMKGNKGNTFLDQRKCKRVPLKRHLCAWPIRSCLNEGG